MGRNAATLDDPVVPDADTAASAREADGRLAGLLSDGRPGDAVDLKLRVGGRSVSLPAAAGRALAQVLRHLAAGEAVSVVPLAVELSTQQAADLLGVSRPFVASLLDAGEIPSRRVGTHRRVRTTDLLAYKRDNDARRHEALEELVAEGQEMGFYDVVGSDDPDPTAR